MLRVLEAVIHCARCEVLSSRFPMSKPDTSSVFQMHSSRNYVMPRDAALGIRLHTSIPHNDTVILDSNRGARFWKVIAVSRSLIPHSEWKAEIWAIHFTPTTQLLTFGIGVASFETSSTFAVDKNYFCYSVSNCSTGLVSRCSDEASRSMLERKLSESQKTALISEPKRHAVTLDLNSFSFVQATAIPHAIDIGDAFPLRSLPYRACPSEPVII